MVANSTTDYLPRHVKAKIEEELAFTRIVNLVGPRQVGKTTLVRTLFGGDAFITLDDPSVLETIESDAKAQLLVYLADLKEKPLIIDEIQRSRELILAIKQIVDADSRKGQFILTGSSNVFARKKVSDSLAGRTMTLKLWPLTVAEIKRSPANLLMDWAMQESPDLAQIPKPEPTSREEYIGLMLAGGFPDMRLLPLRARQNQYRNYIDSVVDRDVADIFPIRKPDSLRIMINQMAVRTSGEINITELGKLTKLRRDTVEQYLDILVDLSIVTKLDAWASAEAKRGIRQSKYHFVDSGIVCALRQLTDKSFALGNQPQALGGVLESFVVAELQRSLPFQKEHYKMYHWRNRDRREIDIMIDGGDRFLNIQVKSSSSVRSDDFKHLKWFASEGPGRGKTCTGVVLYLGDGKFIHGNRNFALPVSTLWSSIEF